MCLFESLAVKYKLKAVKNIACSVSFRYCDANSRQIASELYLSLVVSA